jgi:hypothetical protein
LPHSSYEEEYECAQSTAQRVYVSSEERDCVWSIHVWLASRCSVLFALGLVPSCPPCASLHAVALNSYHGACSQAAVMLHGRGASLALPGSPSSRRRRDDGGTTSKKMVLPPTLSASTHMLSLASSPVLKTVVTLLSSSTRDSPAPAPN